ncbi:MAG: hypothetical protein R2741_10255 [Methanolobus sp.]
MHVYCSTQINVTGNKIDFVTPASFDFPDNTDGKDYSINIINGNSTVGYCTFSGRLSNGESYTFARYWVADPIITMHSSEISITRDLPISCQEDTMKLPDFKNDESAVSITVGFILTFAITVLILVTVLSSFYLNGQGRRNRNAG